MKNLWPEFQKKEEIAPKAIINKQAEFFDALGIGLRANVSSVQGYDDDILAFGDKIWLVHTFRIKAIALDGFTFTLFRAKHKTTAMYPVHIYDNLTSIKYEAKTPSELETVLGEIFSTEETKEAIKNVMSQL